MNLLQARTEIPEHLDVTLAVIVKDDKLLLARKLQKIGAGLWNGPGGKIEAGETPSQAIVRECEEELCIRPTEFVAAGEIYFYFPDDPKWNMHCFVYRVMAWDGTPAPTAEMASPSWFDRKELPFSEMWPDDEIWLPRIILKETIHASFLFGQQKTILEYELAGTTRAI